MQPQELLSRVDCGISFAAYVSIVNHMAKEAKKDTPSSLEIILQNYPPVPNLEQQSKLTQLFYKTCTETIIGHFNNTKIVNFQKSPQTEEYIKKFEKIENVANSQIIRRMSFEAVRQTIGTLQNQVKELFEKMATQILKK